MVPGSKGIMPLSDLDSISGNNTSYPSMVYDDSNNKALKELSDMMAKKAAEVVDKLAVANGVLSMATGQGKSFDFESYGTTFKAHKPATAKILQMPKPSPSYFNAHFDHLGVFYTGSETTWEQIRREKLRDGAEKVVRSFNQQQKKHNPSALSHYNAPTYGKKQKPTATVQHSSNNYMVEAIVNFALDKLRELDEKHNEQMNAMHQHYDERTTMLHNKINFLEQQIHNLTTAKETAIAELAVVREREARLSIIDNTDGRRFRHEE